MRLPKTSIYISDETRARQEALFPGKGAGWVYAELLRRAERGHWEEEQAKRVLDMIEARFELTPKRPAELRGQEDRG